MSTIATSRWLRFALVSVLALVHTAGGAQTTGMNPPYFKIDFPQQVTDTPKVEVVEVFNYGCIHCAQFQGYVNAWRKTADTGKVEFVYLPATFNQTYLDLARGFYAASDLKLAEKTHDSVFEAIHVRGVPLRSFDDVVGLYTRLGVPREAFVKSAKSFFVEAQLRRAAELLVRYRVDSTPTLIVAGKYRITSDSAGSQEAMFDVANRLIAQELAQKKSTSRQAPKSGK